MDRTRPVLIVVRILWSEAEGELGVFAPPLGRPRRREDHRRGDVVDASKLPDELLDLLCDLRTDRATGAGQRERDIDRAAFDGDVVDQAKLDEIQSELGVDHLAKGLGDVIYRNHARSLLVGSADPGHAERPAIVLVRRRAVGHYARVSSGDHPRAAARGDELKTILGVIASVVGLAAYVYLAGWIVDLVRFSAARLPAGAAAAALSSQELFGDGLRSTLLMAAAFAVACALAYFSSARNWDVHGQDWHDIVRKGGVAKAAADPDADRQRRLREHRHAKQRAERADALVARSNGLVARVAGRVRSRAALSAADGPVGTPKPLEPAPLGDGAVRIIAGFNIMVLSALIAVGVGRAVGAAIPIARWVGVLIGLLVFLGARRALTRSSPLVLDSRIHAVVWGFVAVATLFAAAPVGVLVLTAVAVSTLGRTLARVQQPHSPAEFLRSPLPWALLTVCLLVGLAYSATPPVSFPQVTVSTASGTRTGGYLTRTSAGVYVVTCTALADATSSDERLDFIPTGEVQGVRIGGDAEYLDSGQRPSIATLALRALGINASPPTLFSASLRAEQPTCAGGGPSHLSTGTEDPALGAGVIAGPAPAGGRAYDGEPPIEATSPAPIAALARRYQPTLLVTVADRNWPVSVNTILAERGPHGEPVCLVQARAPQHVCPPTAASLGGPGAASSDYLQLPVTLSSDQSPNGQFQAFLRGQYISSGHLDHWLADPGVLDPWYSAQIYFYYAGPISSSQFPKQARDPSVPSGLIGLEYWFYYPFNYYPLIVNADLMDGAPIAGDHENVDLHQGDWEHVDVLLDPRTMTPAWLYMARHSYEGQFVPWSSPELTFDQGHPVLQAAFGGHPTYLPGCGARPRAVTHYLSSDWLSCGSGRFAFRAATTPLVDIAHTPWACWPGYFGEASTKLEVNAAGEPENVADSIKHFVFVAGPRAPLTQAENTGVCKSIGGPTAAESAAAATQVPRPLTPGHGTTSTGKPR